jgi:pyrroloquinoline quinone biosynthesis protein B
MRVKILGSAAGGAFPQWNCACANCRALRAGSFRGKARSQAQVAISNDGKTWFLLGASPDLRAQIEATPELHPPGSEHTPEKAGRSYDAARAHLRRIEAKALRKLGRRSRSGKLRSRPDGAEECANDQVDVRDSPIAGVVLANADVDHVLGLFVLRELQPLSVYATDSIHRILTEDNSMFAMLQRVADQVRWTGFAPRIPFRLLEPSGADSGLRCHALSLGAHYPAYVSPQRQGELNSGEASLGLIVESKIAETSSGKRLAYMPAVPQIDDALLQEFESADVLLFDGTFWSDDELIRIQGSGHNVPTARQMGHVPVSSAEGSLSRLAGLRRPRKIYVHINNTNPMLNEAGPEYAQVRAAGWEIAEDGWQFDL